MKGVQVVWSEWKCLDLGGVMGARRRVRRVYAGDTGKEKSEVAAKVGLLPSISTTEVAACPPIFSTLFAGPGKLMRR